jgi:hypothetical protein
MLGMLALAVASWAIRSRLIRLPERITFSAIAVFCIAVAYATCASFAHTKGEAEGASPWYTQVLLVPVISLAFLGMSRCKRTGSVVAALTTALWGWVLVATWTLKLFPMYSGAPTVPMHTREFFHWYTRNFAVHYFDLSLVALAPAAALYTGLVLSLALTVYLCARIIRSLILSPEPGNASRQRRSISPAVVGS